MSPSSPIEPAMMAAGCEALHRRGFKTRLFPHALDSTGFLAGSDNDRAADLRAAFLDPEVDAVLCSRGGYGAARLLPLLDFDEIAAHLKPFLGYSDVTALHLALARRGAHTFHAPMVTTFAGSKPDWVFESFEAALAGGFLFPATLARPATVVSGRAKGIVDGGCLTLLADSLGTPHAFDGRGKLVLIEDVHERPHRIDAALTHLLNAGALDEAAGFIVGEMTGTNAQRAADDPPWEDIFTDRLARLGVPMIFGFPFGHIEAMVTLPLGLTAELDADAGTLVYATER